MELEFNKEHLGKIYNIEMSEEFIKDYEEYEKRLSDEERDFDSFLKENGIKL